MPSIFTLAAYYSFCLISIISLLKLPSPSYEILFISGKHLARNIAELLFMGHHLGDVK